MRFSTLSRPLGGIKSLVLAHPGKEFRVKKGVILTVLGLWMILLDRERRERQSWLKSS